MDQETAGGWWFAPSLVYLGEETLPVLLGQAPAGLTLLGQDSPIPGQLQDKWDRPGA